METSLPNEGLTGPITFETEVADGILFRDLVQLVLANRENVKRLVEETGILPPALVIPKNGYLILVEAEEEGTGFTLALSIKVQETLEFTSLQLDADFAPGVNFLDASPGDIISHFGFGYQATDGHPKEGRVGAYSGTPVTLVPGTYALCNLHFEGPPGSEYSVTLNDFALNLWTSTIPGVAIPGSNVNFQ